MKKFLLGILGAILFITSWELLVIIKQDASLVGVDRITKAFIEIVAKKEFYINLFSTLKIVFIGIAIATACGIILAVIMDLSEGARYILTPLIEALRNIPSITLFPILLVLYGIGDTARIFVIFWTAFPSVIISSAYGLKNIDGSVIEAAKMDGANAFEVMRSIKFPLAMPEMLNGIKIGIGSGFVAIKVYSLGLDNYENIEKYVQEITIDGDFDIAGFDTDILKSMTRDISEIKVDMQNYGVIDADSLKKPVIPPATPNVQGNTAEAQDTGNVTPEYTPASYTHEKQQVHNEKTVICPNCGEVIVLD